MAAEIRVFSVEQTMYPVSDILDRDYYYASIWYAQT